MRARVSAIHYDNGQPQTDRLEIIVSVGTDGAVVADECFGVVIDENDRYPFTGNPDGADIVLDYGHHGKGKEIGHLNLIGKRLSVGELFTRVDHFRGDPAKYEYTYRIEAVD